MTWALYETPGIDPTARLVLCVLADHAHNDGTAAFPSLATISEVVGIAPRNVRNHIRKLEAQGLIKRGNQLHVAYIRQDRRPTVYDLAMSDVQRIKNIAKAPKKNGGMPASPRAIVDNVGDNSPKTVDKAVHENVDNNPRGDAESPHGGMHGGMPASSEPLTQKINLSAVAGNENYETCRTCDVAKPDDQMTAGGVCRDCVMHGPSSEGRPGWAAVKAMQAEMKAKREAKEREEREAHDQLQRALQLRRSGATASSVADTSLATYGALDDETYRTGSAGPLQPSWGQS